MKQAESQLKSVRAGDKYKISLYVGVRYMRVALAIEALPEVEEYKKLKDEPARMRWYEEHSDERFEASVFAIYKRERIRTVQERNLVDEARTILRLSKKYGGVKP